MATTVHKPLLVSTENSKIYDKVTETIRVTANINYLLHADEHTVVVRSGYRNFEMEGRSM